LLDELEEWRMLMQHYCFSLASVGMPLLTDL